jgi:hypothetical protein
MQQSIVKFIALSYRHCSTYFEHNYAHHQEPVELPLHLLVSVSIWRWKCSQSTTAENTSTSTFIWKPEAAKVVWQTPDDGHNNARNMLAVSVRQSNKILGLIVSSSWMFYLSDWRCTEPHTLNTILQVLLILRY